jgi:CO/xanthine dehydrogenase FAD-binding subunit
MLLNLLEYNWAEDIDDALMLLARTDIKTVPLAGGTYLLGQQDDSIQAVVDLRDLDLAYINEDTRGVHIGAMTTLQAIADSPELQSLASGLLARTARASSFSHLIRNSATLGGTLATGAPSQADLLTALAVLDAEILLRSGSKTKVDLAGGSVDRPGFALAGVTFKGKNERRAIYHGANSRLDRRPNELIIEAFIPRPAPNAGASFLRVGRTPTDVALINVAALVEVSGGLYQQVRLALGGVNMEPVRLHAVEQALQGQRATLSDAPDAPLNMQQLVSALQAGMADFTPPSDFRASSGYRRISGLNLALRTLEEATHISRLSSEGRQS